jgi:predicted TIM-barrel fold metal-dependent hydrolase
MNAMSKQSVRMLSCDTHLEHWPTVLKDYVPKKLHDLFDKAPFMVTMFNQVPHYGEDSVTTSVLAGYRNFSEVKRGTIDIRSQNIPGAYGGPDEYAHWMHLDGVTKAVLLPGAALGATIGAARATGDKDAYMAVLQGYNDFINDFSLTHPEMFLGGACIPGTGVDDAIAEMERVRKMPGIHTVAPGSFPNGSTSPTDEDDRFWAASLDLDMPITMHGGISTPTNGIKTDRDAATWIIGHVEITTGGPYSATQLIMSGVFDRFPDLRVIILECGAGWLPFSMDVMNHFYDRQRFWAGIDLKNPPAWYCTSGNLLWNIICDKTAIRLRDEIGVDNLSWSSDFPHGNSEWPESRSRALKLLDGCTDEERDKILWSNAAKFYRLDK